MFLKRLELHGFKSFAHKTVIEFMEGSTVVVGPNGCGKSNVLDAIRWVLGETSAKSLRGAKMGDVVFRGSSSMKPAHFSQVNLVLDNSAGLLKIDQSEVVVTRRLFSNGDSEYLINKQKARMRDIHELFMDTGLGADGYSIIEQGQIGQLVNSKPRDRRDLFEEAAGISRYKARREETLRKLVRTEEDLLRLFDIVSEVQKSCNSLYRAAKKAERHRRLSLRLSRLKRHLIVLRHRMQSDKLPNSTRACARPMGNLRRPTPSWPRPRPTAPRQRSSLRISNARPRTSSRSASTSKTPSTASSVVPTAPASPWPRWTSVAPSSTAR